MKVLKKINYSEDVDILTIQLSNKKIDDSYETNYGVVSVSEDGEPVLIEVFKANEFLKDLGRAVPKSIQKEVWSQTSVAVPQQIRK